MKISIITPCLNSEKTLKFTLNSLITQDYKNIEHIIVDGGSSDGTLKTIQQYKFKNKKIVIANKSKLYEAINIGIQKSKGDYVCIMMSDSSDTVEDLNTYYEVISNYNLDAVFGSRFIKGGKTVNYPLLKMILNRMGNLLAKFLLWTDLNDFTNGFKIYKRDSLVKLYPLVSESFNIFFELPLKLIIRGFKYKIIPISYYNRTVGEAKFKIDELGSKYIFTLLYCFLEKILLNKKIK
jgi:dolichol-phosphate mannosyltransferase